MSFSSILATSLNMIICYFLFLAEMNDGIDVDFIYDDADRYCAEIAGKYLALSLHFQLVSFLCGHLAGAVPETCVNMSCLERLLYLLVF